MTLKTLYIVYPEGDIQEIERPLTVNQVVDINGNPLAIPLRGTRLIAYRVYKVQAEEKKGETNKFHYLELLNREDMLEYLA